MKKTNERKKDKLRQSKRNKQRGFDEISQLKNDIIIGRLIDPFDELNGNFSNEELFKANKLIRKNENGWKNGKK